MPQDRSIYNDEIDLIELFKTSWDNKWLIIVFTLISLLVSIGFIYLKDPQYESKLFYAPNNFPPFYSADMVSNNFKTKFFSKNNFETWKKSIGKTPLAYEDLVDTKVIEGFIVEKKESAQMIRFGSKRRAGLYIIVNSNQLNILDDIFKYSNYINKIMQDNYVMKANEEIEKINLFLKDTTPPDADIIKQILANGRFISSANKGLNTVEIKRPTYPEKISPIIPLVLTLAIVIGVTFGVTFVLLRNAVRQRKKIAEA